MSKRIIQVEEKLPAAMALPLSIQHVFAMFGASILVPIIFGIDAGIVLLMNGIGTLIFSFLTKGKAPAYLGSSFAFLAPAGVIIAAKGFEYAQGGFVAVGIAGCILALIIYKCGTKWLDIILPPAAMGPVVALIGLELAANPVSGGSTGVGLLDGSATGPEMAVFFITLAIAVFGSVVFRKFFSVIPILIAIISGYAVAFCFGLVDFSPVKEASLFTLPAFSLAKFDMQSIMIMLPVLLVVTAEHVGHQLVTGGIINKDLIREPGLHRSLLGDNISTAISGFVGSVPTTTYGENIGVMAMTGVYSVQVIRGAAVISILMAFIGPLSALISTIPGPVIGGTTFLLYGTIGTAGLRLLVDRRVDYAQPQNLALTSVVFVAGLSGIAIHVGTVTLSGMTLAAAVAVTLSLCFYILKKLHLTNDFEERVVESQKKNK